METRTTVCGRGQNRMESRQHFAFLDRLPSGFGLLGLLGLLVATTIVGCGPRDSLRLAPVHGTVTYQGKPLEHGRVVFNPEDESGGVAAVGIIASDGSYEMRTRDRDGAALGKYLVTIQCRQKRDEKHARDMSYIPPLLIPKKYWSLESPLRFEVQDGENHYPIVLE